tara:strand:+ start:1294 stop:1446 length:153 start_codon:yes stop_codon:yes gene_type:complete
MKEFMDIVEDEFRRLDGDYTLAVIDVKIEEKYSSDGELIIVKTPYLYIER